MKELFEGDKQDTEPKQERTKHHGWIELHLSYVVEPTDDNGTYCLSSSVRHTKLEVLCTD